MGKTIQEAYPDWSKHREFVGAANIEIEKEVKPFLDELVAKHPLYGVFAMSAERIYHEFQMERIPYITA